MKHPARTTRSHQQGTSLLEVLISLLILAVGMIGMAGLQTTALKASQSSSERSAAILQTYSIASVLQADRIGAQSFRITSSASDPVGPSFLEKSVAKWRRNIRQELGDTATGSITCHGAGAGAVNFGSCTVTITWDDSRVENSSENFSLTTEIPL